MKKSTLSAMYGGKGDIVNKKSLSKPIYRYFDRLNIIFYAYARNSFLINSK